jgi:hypothetical protein
MEGCDQWSHWTTSCENLTEENLVSSFAVMYLFDCFFFTFNRLNFMSLVTLNAYVKNVEKEEARRRIIKHITNGLKPIVPKI